MYRALERQAASLIDAQLLMYRVLAGSLNCITQSNESSKKDIGEVEQLQVVKGLERCTKGEAGGSFVPDRL